MKNYHQRLDALEKKQGALRPVSTFIMATDRADADRQVRRFEADHPGYGKTLFVMIGPGMGAVR